ncbi:hypothetical protein PHJA_002595000 [Phtheirospermum japonicum]|uniref:Uncharacterized protein n=1 Tax=Phtheirospermum japonicum TaxID=374723 RepID=A0A830CX75_9LAMI|nr:hypothetical protein PHJA_002595000 [Phtheirospermum japonicum]
MKMIKAMKKLKFWPRIKKRKKNILLTESPPPPSRPPPPPPPGPYYPTHSQYEPLLPSAPPLPPWLEYDMQFQETHSTPSADHETDIAHEILSLSNQESQATNISHHQYIVSDPIYDKSVVPQLVKLEKGSGAFGCVVGFGVHLVRCVFPCFHIREEVSLNSLK